MKILFGDIHNHCGISYGYGGLKNTLKNAASHLDFCAVTGHAFWPDIPKVTDETSFLVDFHQRGFLKLQEHYREYIETIEEFNSPGKFTTFVSYEMHNSHFGDHHLVSGDSSIPLLKMARTPHEWFQESAIYKDTVIIPHHIAYTPEYRGISWVDYDEKDFPVVEVVSKHGCSMSDNHPFPYYHSMGGRDSRNTVYAGLRAGHRFGFVGSTDHHAGYPGSYNDGLTAVITEENNRHSIIEAIKKRRTYAVRGDRIKCMFTVNGFLPGDIVSDHATTRFIEYELELSYFLDKLIIFKNLKPIKIINGEEFVSTNEVGLYKIRIEFGWGSMPELYTWNFECSADGGTIIDIEKCFRGKNILAPSKNVFVPDDVNIIDNHAQLIDNKVIGTVQTSKNHSTTAPSTCAVVLTVKGSLDTVLSLIVNGKQTQYSIRELSNGSYTHQMGITNSQNFKIYQAIPETQYLLSGIIEDKEGKGKDYYHLEVFQKNGSMIFVSPIYFE